MRSRTLQRLLQFRSRRMRLLLAVPTLAAGLSFAASNSDAQTVRPSIGRYHSDRANWNDWSNEGNINNRYLQRQAEPRFEERRTHLGWEVRGRTYTVMANSSRDDALLAARTIEATWGDTLRMADYWTDRHEHANFSVAAISVHIDQNPRRENQEGDLRFVNDRTHIYLNVAAGEAPASEQLGKLRASTVHAFWRRSELDLELPSWVRNGLASYVATGQAIAQGDQTPIPPGSNYDVYDPYWQRERISRTQLAPAEQVDEQAALRVRYLLEGDDARHAPAFFAALAATSQELPPRTQFGGTRRYEPNDHLRQNTSVDDFYSRVSSGMGEWLSNPMVDQPQIVPLEGHPQLLERQQQMAFLLKIAKRQNDSSSGTVKTKIIGGDTPSEFGRGNRELSIAGLWNKVGSADTPLWATLDPQGNLLLSDQTERLRQFFEPNSGGYRSTTHEGHWAIETWVDRNTRLIGWLEENPEVPRQPLAKFERIVQSETKTSQP